MKNKVSNSTIRVALVVPHIFMHRDILPQVIFSPGHLALALARELQRQGAAVTLYTPGPVDTTVATVTADLSLFDRELAGRGDSYTDLLRKHPFTFVTLARQVQSELLARAYEAANRGEHDIIHVYTNEEEVGYAFAGLCRQPVVFTHHDPFNFLVKYKNNLPKYKHLNWISLSLAQRRGMPGDTNWLANIPHGLDDPELSPVAGPTRDYVAYMGRIIEPKGVHLAIEAVRRYNQTTCQSLPLKIAGKHYADAAKDSYWQQQIAPRLGSEVQFVGFLATSAEKRDFLGNARALVVPSLFDEPFGMVSLEAFACATPVVALDSGALPEVVENGLTGFVVPKTRLVSGKIDDKKTAESLAEALERVDTLNPRKCRLAYETRFTAAAMAREHLKAYRTAMRRLLT
ncbi:MAG: glycosyltransferase [Acidobacteriota bacterium]